MNIKKTELFICSALCLIGCSGINITQNQQIAKLTVLADRLEILNLLAGSAFSSDVASEIYWSKMFTDNATFDRGATKKDIGKTEIMKIITAPEQKQAIKAGMTHLAMQPYITLKGDHAEANGYLLIVMPDSTAAHVKLAGKGVSPGFSIYQITFNKWQLVKTNNSWNVTQRTIRPIANLDTRALIQQAIEENN
jgi:SnoaL-like domain